MQSPYTGIITSVKSSDATFNNTVDITITDTDEVNEYRGLDIALGQATFEKDLHITIDSQGTKDVSKYNHSGGQVIHGGITIESNAVTTLNGKTVIDIKNKIYNSYAYGAEIWGAGATFVGNDLAVNINKGQTVFATGEAGTNRSNGVVLGGGNGANGKLSGDMDVVIATGDWCNGIEARENSEFTVQGNAVIDVYSQQGLAVGVHSDGAGVIILEKGLEVISNGDAIRVNEREGYSGGTVKVNTAGGNDVKLTGDLYSGDGGTINVMFDTAQSHLTGSSYTESGSMTELSFKNGAFWNVKSDSVVSKLTVGAGSVIDMTADGGAYSDLSADDLTADGSTFKMNVGSEDEAHKYSDKVVLTNSAAGSNNIEIVTTGGLEEAAANQAVLVSGAGKDTKFAVGSSVYAGGIYDYDVNLDVKAHGDTNKYDWYIKSVTGNLGDNITAMLGSNQAAYSAWVDGNSALRQRLGELQSGADNGVWVRMFGGKLGSDEFTNKYKTYQLGYDAKAGDWLIGAAYEYTDGSLSYNSGSGENKIGAVSLYGTLQGKDNSALDIVIKSGRIYGNTDIYGKYSDSSDYATDATSFGVEYTKRLDAGNNVYVEPQAQLTYGRIDGYNYTSRNGIAVNYDAISSLIGRLGVEAGKDFGSGRAYVKASVLHEFSGSGAVTMLAANGESYKADKDYGETWLELGLGGSVALGKNFQLYGDVERSFGGDVTKNWGANLGVQYSF